MLKLQYFGHLMQIGNSLEKSLMLGKIEGRRRRGCQSMRRLDGITNEWSRTWTNSGRRWGTGAWRAAVHGGCRESQMTGPLNNCIAKENFPLLFKLKNRWFGAFLVTQMVKHLPAMQETWIGSLGREDPLEKGMTTLSSTFAWRIPWTEEPGRLQSMGSQTEGHHGSQGAQTLEHACIGDRQPSKFFF